MVFKFHNLKRIFSISRLSSRADKSLHPSSPYASVILLEKNPTFAISRRWHLGHSHHHHRHDSDDNDSNKEGEKIFKLGLNADIGLTVGKAFTGYLSGSTAIIADAAHSLSDVVLSSVALWSFKAARVPNDSDHPYGHGKFETLGALGISCMLLATAGGIAWHAVDLLLGVMAAAPESVNHSLIREHNQHAGGHHHGIDMAHPILALSMTVVSISIKEGLYWMTKRAGERTGSGLMMANAWHHRADAISSVVALIGVGGAILGVKIFDPLAGLLVSGMILKAGIETGYQSVLELVDAAIPAQELIPIRKTIEQIEGVKGCHRLRARRAGSFLYLDVHIEVDPFLSVSAAHDIGEKVRQQIHKSHPEVAEVFIHIDPALSQALPNIIDRREKQEESKDEESQTLDVLPSGQNKVEVVVSEIFSTKFPEKMVVERITRHLLQGKTLLQVEVSMPAHLTIGDAMQAAEEAEREILKAASNVVQASIQLRLGHPIHVIRKSQGCSSNDSKT